jgi:hypothetical protein
MLSPEAQTTLTEKQTMLQILQQHLAKAQHTMKKQADKKRTPRSFELGDMVYLKMQPYREHALGTGNPLKLASRWYGPFKVIQLVGNRAYKLQLPQVTLLHDVFHVNQLKKHLGPRAVPNRSLPMVTHMRCDLLAPSSYSHALLYKRTFYSCYLLVASKS